MKRKMHESDRGVWLGIVFVGILIGAVALMADFIKKENERKTRWN